VEEESFAAALFFLEEYLRWPGERYRYLPKLPEAGLFEGAEGEEDLMNLVKAFLETLEE
jgi:hypothetical protein